MQASLSLPARRRARPGDVERSGFRRERGRRATTEAGTTPTRERRVLGLHAFTLVELLVVIALIAVIAGLLLPVLAQVREEGRRVTCLSQLRQISQAHALYLQDCDEQLADWRLPAPPRPEPWGPHRYWTEYLQPYLHSEAVLRDPSDTGPPLPPHEGMKLAGYALMTWGPSGSGAAADVYFRWAGPPLSLAQVLRPAETVSVMDGHTATEQSQGFDARHRQGVHVAFLDGHVRWLPLRELYRVDTDGRGFYWRHYATADR
jgi:prepilin-type N-terminal cleavage/methylation domain-containing protein/prepilin-type processing-associated H-X9-DG protein